MGVIREDLGALTTVRARQYTESAEGGLFETSSEDCSRESYSSQV